MKRRFTPTVLYSADEPAGGAPPEPAGDASEPKVFTEEQVTKIVQTRLAKDRRERPSDDELERLRERARLADELEKATQTDVERAQAERDAALAQAEAAAAARAALSGRLVDSEIARHAQQAGANPELLSKIIDRAAVVVGDDGQPQGVDDAVKAALENFPELVGKPVPPVSGLDAGPRNTPPIGSIADQIAEAEKSGDFAAAMTLKAEQIVAAKPS